MARDDQAPSSYCAICFVGYLRGARQDVLYFLVPAEGGDLSLLHARVLESGEQGGLGWVRHVPDADIAVRPTRREEVPAKRVELQSLHRSLVLLERANKSLGLHVGV